MSFDFTRLFKNLTLTFALAACARPQGNVVTPADGGQDNGGGNTFGSTQEEVKEAIDLAMKVALDCSPNAYLKGFGTDVLNSPLRTEKLGLIVQRVFFPGIAGMVKGLDYTPSPKHQGFPYLCNYLRESPIRYETVGSCAVKDNDHADASVSAHEIGAEICISVANLTRISKANLFREVLSLIVHESAHLVGLRETDAKEVQQRLELELQKANTLYSPEIVDTAIRSNLLEAKRQLILARDRLDRRSSSQADASHSDDPVRVAAKLLTLSMPDTSEPRIFKVAVELQISGYRALIKTPLDRAWKTLALSFPEAGDAITSAAWYRANELNGPLNTQYQLGRSTFAIGKILDSIDLALEGLDKIKADPPPPAKPTPSDPNAPFRY